MYLKYLVDMATPFIYYGTEQSPLAKMLCDMYTQTTTNIRVKEYYLIVGEGTWLHLLRDMHPDCLYPNTAEIRIEVAKKRNDHFLGKFLGNNMYLPNPIFEIAD